MSNRRVPRGKSPELKAFMAEARSIGFEFTDRDWRHVADALLIGFQAPECDYDELVKTLLATGKFGGARGVELLVLAGQRHLVGAA